MRALVREVEPRIPAAQAAFNEKLRQRLLDAVQRRSTTSESVRRWPSSRRASMSPRNWRAWRPISMRSSACSDRRRERQAPRFPDAGTQSRSQYARFQVAGCRVSQTAIEFKLLIEQMREQVQNLE
jgi:hypothetical protein